MPYDVKDKITSFDLNCKEGKLSRLFFLKPIRTVEKNTTPCFQVVPVIKLYFIIFKKIIFNFQELDDYVDSENEVIENCDTPDGFFKNLYLLKCHN